MLQATPHAYHFKRIFSFGEGQPVGIVFCVYGDVYYSHFDFRRQVALLPQVLLLPPFNQNLDEAYLSLTITGLRFI